MLGGFSDFSGQKCFVHHRVDFVEVENQVELAHVVEILIQNLKRNLNPSVLDAPNWRILAFEKRLRETERS